ncbi:MAG: cobalamin biosynthesis protein, partial [Thermodesulfovibrionales bacterium]
ASSWWLRAFRAVAPPPRDSIVVTLRDGKKSPSPNSGYPEAALAGALGIRLGGPSTYKGVLVEKPFIGLSLRQITIEVAEEAMSLFYLSAFMGGIIAVGVRL